ncbi:hypothetical protein GPECTOR_594g665 [Gonium pectorale]|uniref:Uncharacterized protein n=1 Tax=Gonium pectorale TaxID=33097 RepID=A0A150FUE7_GONPE|nr:hypothetical protein GPECTOR_594g665 [Gonium pectorale]|eukprot:KXZ41263.1 hypothetical protein GPECTOR_594g665 [Gonium pectorale]
MADQNQQHPPITAGADPNGKENIETQTVTGAQGAPTPQQLAAGQAKVVEFITKSVLDSVQQKLAAAAPAAAPEKTVISPQAGNVPAASVAADKADKKNKDKKKKKSTKEKEPKKRKTSRDDTDSASDTSSDSSSSSSDSDGDEDTLKDSYEWVERLTPTDPIGFRSQVHETYGLMAKRAKALIKNGKSTEAKAVCEAIARRARTGELVTAKIAAVESKGLTTADYVFSMICNKAKFHKETFSAKAMIAEVKPMAMRKSKQQPGGAGGAGGSGSGSRQHDKRDYRDNRDSFRRPEGRRSYGGFGGRGNGKSG